MSLAAESRLHGAAIALRQFAALGCDVTCPLARVDMTEADGTKHTLPVEEILDWLNDPKQRLFVHHECLGALLHWDRAR